MEEVEEKPNETTFSVALGDCNAEISSVEDAESGKAAPQKANLGTIAEIYLLCIQSTFGVLFFIRFAWIVGTAGVILGFIIVFLCCCVTFTTSLSLSAIATNNAVPGGLYSMLSRSLSPEFGGVVGIFFYLATTLSGAMYLVGAVEIFLNYLAPQLSLYGDFWEDNELMYQNFRTYGTVLLVLLGIMMYIGIVFLRNLVNVPVLFSVISIIFVLFGMISIIFVYTGVFVNMNGKEDVNFCALGYRILSSIKYNDCSKDQNVQGSLFHVYCKVNINATIGDPVYKCDEYFEENEAREIQAIPGLLSGVFYENFPTRFREKGSFTELSDEYLDDTTHKTEESYNQLILDISTSFSLLVGIFFPTCAGIMADFKTAGDLEDTRKSIPAGTLAAQITTTLVHCSSVFLYAASFDNLFLRDKFGESIGGRLPLAMLAWPNPAIIIVVTLLSAIGAAIQSLTSAPFLLQAIARHGIIPFLNVFKHNNLRETPTRALLLTLVICELGILIGNVDHIAPVLTTCFLTCFTFVNVACVVQSLLKKPNWKPQFCCYHWFVSLLGVLLCQAVLFISNWYYALASMVLAFVIYIYIKFKG